MKILRADAPVRIQPRETCTHDRIYTWFPRLIGNDPDSPVLLCGGCCDCGHAFTRLAPAGLQPYRGKVPDRYAPELAEAIS
jgi:hypothetical protein